MPSPMQRLKLLHNVVEEHGEFDVAAFHVTSFSQFLDSIGVESPAGTPPGAIVDGFNQALIGVCASESVALGACCLGVIEYAFAGASAAIGRAVVDRGWIASEEDLRHYKLHAEIDRRHAAELFEIAEPLRDAAAELEAMRGVRLGAYLFDRLYRDLAAS